MPHKQATLIALDGPDGVGKTTQLALLAQALEHAGHRVYQTRLNGGTPIGEALRTVYLGNTPRSVLTDFYIAQAIYSAVIEDLDQKREHYDYLLLDRSPLSLIAYQVFGSGLAGKLGYPAAEAALDQLKPDLLICYRAPRAAIEARRSGRNAAANNTYFEQQPQAFIGRVDQGFQQAAQRFGATVVDAGGSVDNVHAATMAIVARLT